MIPIGRRFLGQPITGGGALWREVKSRGTWELVGEKVGARGGVGGKLPVGSRLLPQRWRRANTPKTGSGRSKWGRPQSTLKETPLPTPRSLVGEGCKWRQPCKDRSGLHGGNGPCDGSPHTRSPNLSSGQPAEAGNKVTGLLSEFKFPPDSTSAPSLGELLLTSEGGRTSRAWSAPPRPPRDGLLGTLPDGRRLCFRDERNH